MKIEQNQDVRFDKTDKVYIIKTTITETLTQKDMFARLQQKRQMLTGINNNINQIKQKKRNMRQEIENFKKNLNQQFKNIEHHMANKKSLMEELDRLESATKDDEEIQKRFKLFEELVKEYREKQQQLQNQANQMSKEFQERMNK